MRKIIVAILVAMTFMVGQVVHGQEELSESECLILELLVFDGDITGGICSIFPATREFMTDATMAALIKNDHRLTDSATGTTFSYQFWEHIPTGFRTLTVQIPVSDFETVVVIYDYLWFITQ